MNLRERLSLYWRHYRYSERAFVFLPFLLLTPRLVPDLEVGHNGEPSQEFVITLAIFGLFILLGFEAHRFDFYWQGRSRWLLWAAAAFAGWSGCSLLWTGDLAGTQDHTILWLNYVAIIFAGRIVLRRRSVIGLMTTLVATGLGIAFFRLSQYWISIGARPLTSPIFKNYGVEAELLVTILPLIWVLQLTVRRRRLSISLLVIASIVLMGALSTYQRTPILAMMLSLGLLTVGVLTKWVQARSKWRFVALCGALLLSSSWQMSLPSKQDSQGRQNGSEFVRKQVEGIRELETDTSSRLQFWGTALEMARAHPLLGIGAGSYKSNYLTYRGIANQHPLWGNIKDFSQTEGAACVYRTHNEYLEILSELGLTGIVLLGAMLVALAGSIWKTSQQQRWLAVGVGICAVAFLLSSSLTSYSFRWVPCGAMFFLLASLVLPMTRPSATDSISARRWIPAICALLLFCGIARTGQVLLSEHYQYQAQQQTNEDQVQSIALYQKALAIDPYNFSASAGLGTMFYRRNSPALAIGYLERGRQHGVNDLSTLTMLSFAYAQIGQQQQAREVLQTTVSAYPGTILTRLLYAEALAREGNPQAANEQRAMVRAIKANDAEVWELILQQGFKAAALTANQQKLPHPAKLQPQNGVGLLQERERLIAAQHIN